MMLKPDQLMDTKMNIAEKRGLCPICGSNMTQSDRLREGKHIFIWYKCVSDICTGERLQKQTVR